MQLKKMQNNLQSIIYTILANANTVKQISVWAGGVGSGVGNGSGGKGGRRGEPWGGGGHAGASRWARERELGRPRGGR